VFIKFTPESESYCKNKNPHKKYSILTAFWLASCNELSLTVIFTKKNLTYKCCHLQLLPIHIFLPGIFFHLKNPIPEKILHFTNTSCCRIKPRTKEKN